MAKKVKGIDRLGETLTVVTVLLGLAIAGTYLYVAWHDPSAAPNNIYRRNTP